LRTSHRDDVRIGRPRRAVLLIGLPGAGKSTLTNALVTTYGCASLSPGEWLRRRAQSGAPQVAARLRHGLPMDKQQSEMFIDLALTRIRHHDCSVVMDGFPRTTAQVGWLRDSLKDQADVPRPVGVYLRIPAVVALNRLGRRSRRSGEEHLRPEARLTVEAAPLSACHAALRQEWPVLELDGCRAVDDLAASTALWLAELGPKGQ